MAPVTEFAIIGLKPGSSLDPSSESGKTLSTMLDTVSAQPGFQRGYYGLEVESPNVLHIFVDWNALEDHHNFMNAPVYGPSMKLLASVMDGTPTLYHASLNPHPPTALSPTVAPCTELLSAYFDPSISDANQKSFESNAQKFVDVLASHAPGNGFKSVSSSGWVIETVQHEGKDAKAFVGAIGWESRDAHIKCRETQAFKDNIHLLREFKGLKGLQACHINAQEVQPGALGGAKSVQEEILNPQSGPKNPPSTISDGMSTKYTK